VIARTVLVVLLVLPVLLFGQFKQQLSESLEQQPEAMNATQVSQSGTTNSMHVKVIVL
jgi:hypothetical protein